MARPYSLVPTLADVSAPRKPKVSVIMSALLDNAVLSIQLELEDFASADARRLISSARNLYTGVLLICKEVLRQLFPPGSNDLLIRIQRQATPSRSLKKSDG